MRGSVAICARLSTWKTPTVSACLQHRVDLRVVRRAGARGPPPRPLPSSSVSESCSAAIMPRPSRSTLMMPRSAQSSLSHCTTTRPGMVAGSSGTTSSSAPWAMTMPPECWPRWRGRSWISPNRRAKSCTRRSSGRSRLAQPALQRVRGVDVLEAAAGARPAGRPPPAGCPAPCRSRARRCARGR